MSNDTLRSFLVDLGFKVDESSWRKFNTSLEGASKQLLRIGQEVAAASAAIVAASVVVANRMEKLAYASQRTGVTVAGLKQIQYAASQVGLSAETAMGSIEGFAEALRMNPGKGALLKNWGISTEDPKKAFEGLLQKLSTMAPYVAAKFAQMFGIAPEAVQPLLQNLRSFMEEQDAYLAKVRRFGLDPQKLAADSKAFNKQLRSLKADLGLMVDVIESRLLPIMTPLVEKFERWISSHADEFAKAVASAFERLANFLEKVNWEDFFQEIDESLPSLETLKNILLAIAGIQLAGIVANLVSMGAALKTLLGAAGVGGAAGAGGGVAALGAALARVSTAAGLALYSGSLNSNEDAELARRGAIGGLGDVDPKSPQGIALQWRKDLAKHPSIMKHRAEWERKYPEAAKWDREHPAGEMTPLQEPNPKTLFQALENRYGLPTGLLDSDWAAESGRGKNMLSPKGARGHFQFMPKTQAEYGLINPDDLSESAEAAARKFQNLIRYYKGNIEKAIAGYNLGEGNLDRVIGQYGDNWKRGLPGETAGYISRVIGGMDATRLGAEGRLAEGKAPVINQTNNVTVTGGDRPHEVADEIGRQQQRLNGNLYREFKGAYK